MSNQDDFYAKMYGEERPCTSFWQSELDWCANLLEELEALEAMSGWNLDTIRDMVKARFLVAESKLTETTASRYRQKRL